MDKKHGIDGVQGERREGKRPVQGAGPRSVLSYAAGVMRQRTYLKTSVLAAVLSGSVYTFLYGLWRIPVIGFGIDRMSAVGVLDYAYLFLIALLTGGLFALFRSGKTQNIASSKIAAGGGFVSAIFAGVCPACQGIQILALGSTIMSIPLAFLVPYLGLLQVVTIFILGFGFYLKANSMYVQTCLGCNAGTKAEHKEKSSGKEPLLYRNHVFAAVAVLVVMLVINGFMITGALTTAGVSSVKGGAISIKPGFEYGPKMTLKPMPLASGESPRFQGYKSIVKPLPTISELEMAAPTGDVVQDIVNNVIPKGTPWYGQEAGVSFDNAVAAATLWGKGRAIQLDADGQKRWERIVNSFTCDYCCGSPQNPTIITRCGCAHSLAAQGMAKWFIKNYGDKYSDEEIYGEMARWYALWYPGPTVKRIAQELQAAN